MNKYEHIWYLIISQYLEDVDVYSLCRTYPWILDRFQLCHRICYWYETTAKHSCMICFARFIYYYELANHCFAVHDRRVYGTAIDLNFTVKISEGRYKCSFCEVSFTKIGRWRTHIHYRHEPIACSCCGRNLIGYYAYRMHQCCAEQKAYRCSQCSKAYYWKNSLMHHINSKHSSL